MGFYDSGATNLHKISLYSHLCAVNLYGYVRFAGLCASNLYRWGWFDGSRATNLYRRGWGSSSRATNLHIFTTYFLVCAVNLYVFLIKLRICAANLDTISKRRLVLGNYCVSWLKFLRIWCTKYRFFILLALPFVFLSNLHVSGGGVNKSVW